MKIQRRSSSCRRPSSSQGPGSSQAVKVPVPAKQSRSRIQPSSRDPARSRFQPSCQGPGSSQAVKVPVPAKLSRSRIQPSQGPGSSQAVKGQVRHPDCISWRSLIRCPSDLRCLTRLKNVPIREKLG